jgi:hypothetical protein
MMLKIACPCGHGGLANAQSLPRELTVLEMRHEPPRSARIVSTERTSHHYLALAPAGASLWLQRHRS